MLKAHLLLTMSIVSNVIGCVKKQKNDFKMSYMILGFDIVAVIHIDLQFPIWNL